jgi:hypothetical protein
LIAVSDTSILTAKAGWFFCAAWAFTDGDASTWQKNLDCTVNAREEAKSSKSAGMAAAHLLFMGHFP